MVKQTVWDVINGLKYKSDIIEVHWMDASKNMRVKRINNTVVATYKKIIGLYWMVEPDSIYGMEHLLFEDLNEGSLSSPTVYSIPIPIITKVRKINSKTLRITSNLGFPILAGKAVKVTQRENGIGEEVNE